MALILHSSPCSYLLSKKSLLLLHSPTKSALLSIKSQDTSSSSSPSSQSSKPTSPSNGDGSSSVLPPPLNKPTSSQGQGFGSASPSPSKPKPSPVSTKKKQKGKRERASVIRRAPVENPEFVSRQEEARASEQIKNESAFLLAWLGLGGVILVEGIALAASGFLPEEWDKFFVKYLYPLFTPTVFLFVAGTVAYGVLKYLQNEKLKNKN